MASIRLNINEDVIDNVRANFGVHGGKLYLTNQRVVYKTNMGSEIWGVNLKDIKSYYLQSAFGINAKLIIRADGVENEFLVPKGSGTRFDECMSNAIQRINANSISEPCSQFEDNSAEDSYNIEYEDNSIDNNAYNGSSDYEYAKRGNYRWIIGVVCLAIGLVWAFSEGLKGCDNATSDTDSIVGKYVYDDGSVVHRKEYFKIRDNGSATLYSYSYGSPITYTYT